MLNRAASLAMSTSVLKALAGKLDIKRRSPSILYNSMGEGEKYDFYVHSDIKEKVVIINITHSFLASIVFVR